MRIEYKIFFFVTPIIFGLLYVGLDAGIQVSWAYSYHNFTEIYTDSDIVIRGVPRTSYQTSFKWETVHQVTILEMIKGEKPAHIISVSQVGGYHFLNKIVEPDSFPLYHKGDELILFLKAGENGNDIKYYSVGGPQGSYEVQESQVFPIGDRFSSNLITNGTDVSIFIDHLKTIE